MSKPIALIGIKSTNAEIDDIITQSLLGEQEDSKDGCVFSGIDIDNKRNFQDVEWIMFALMAIPVAESIVNIISVIKNTIAERVKNKKNTLDKLSSNVEIKIKIKITNNSDGDIEEEITIQIN